MVAPASAIPDRPPSFSEEMPSGVPLPADSDPTPRKSCQLGHGICGSRAGFLSRKRNHSNQQGILLQLSVKLKDVANSHRVVSGGSEVGVVREN